MKTARRSAYASAMSFLRLFALALVLVSTSSILASCVVERTVKDEQGNVIESGTIIKDPFEDNDRLEHPGEYLD